MRNTILFETHKALGAVMGDFGGWNMPLWYKTGQIKEHVATRNGCGLFDICHMGEFMVTGKDSLEFWNKVLTNDVTKLVDNQAQYNFMLNDEGGVVDDCIVYRYSEYKWMLVVNAGTQEGDLEWLQKNIFGDVAIENLSDKMGKLDLQGPTTPKVIAKIAGRESIDGMKFFRFIPEFDLGGVDVILSRTGYTGEIGFEIYLPMEQVEKVWNLLMEAGEEFGITPAGLGARDTLRLEAGLPLHGHEIAPDIPVVGTPWAFAISMEHDFNGKKALEEKQGSVFVYPVTFDGRRKPADHAEVVVGDEVAGDVTSCVLAVSLERKPAAFVIVNRPFELGEKISVRDGKGRLFEAEICSNPLVKGTSRKKMAVMLDK